MRPVRKQYTGIPIHKLLPPHAGNFVIVQKKSRFLKHPEKWFRKKSGVCVCARARACVPKVEKIIHL